MRMALAQKRVTLLLIIQLLLVALVASSLMVLGKSDAARAVLIGGSVGFLPNLLFARACFSLSGARRAPALLKRCYRAEGMKWVLTALLIAIALKVTTPNLLWFLLGFVEFQLSHCLAPLFLSNPVWRVL